MRARSLRSRVPRVAVAAAPLVERRESAERLSHDYHRASQYRVIFFGVATVFIAERVYTVAHVYARAAAELDALRHGTVSGYSTVYTRAYGFIIRQRWSAHMCERADSCERPESGVKIF